MMLGKLVKNVRKLLEEHKGEILSQKKVNTSGGLPIRLARHLVDFVGAEEAAKGVIDRSHLKKLIAGLKRDHFTRYLTRVGGIPHHVAKAAVATAQAKDIHPYDLAVRVASASGRMVRRRNRSALDKVTFLQKVIGLEPDEGDNGGE